MTRTFTPEPPQEPVGIVISYGAREEPAPAVIEYVWGPAPDDTGGEEPGHPSRAAA